MWVNVIPSKGKDILCKQFDKSFGFIRLECRDDNDINEVIRCHVKGDYNVRFKFKSKKLNDDELFYVITMENGDDSLSILTKDKLPMLSYGEKSNLMKVVEAMIDLDLDYKEYWILESFVDLPQNVQWLKYVINKKNKSKRMLEKAKNSNGIILIYSLMLTILFDFLIGQGIPDLRPLGTNITIFNILFLTSFFINNRKQIKKSILGFSFFILSIITSFYFSIYNVAFIRGLDLIFLPIINILLANTLINEFNLSLKSLGGFLSETLLIPFVFIKSSLKKLKKKIKINGRQSKDKEKINAIIIGILLFIPLAAILIWLLSKSDLYFSRFISSLCLKLKDMMAFKNIKLESLIIRMLLMIGVFIYSIAFLLGTSNYKAEPKTKSKQSKSPLIVISFLASLLILYTIYSLIQFPNLYINKNSIGSLYAQYAREGFMQLVIVVIINFVIISICSVLTKGIVANYGKILRFQYTYLIVLTLNMIISSNYKMNMYIDQYGFTRLRFSVKIVLAFLAIVFIIYIINIWRKIMFKKALIMVVFLFCLFINVINIDGYIVKRNLNHYKVTGKIDIEYIIKELSIDSLVEINKVKDEEAYSSLKDEFKAALKKDIKYKDFKEFNFNKYRLINEK